jgi:DNA-binding LacI/PurR family transcriptional regulator
MCPVLTATDQHRPELAERAVERLLQKIHQPETIPTKTLLAGQILERGSVGPPSCTQKNNQSGQETIL